MTESRICPDCGGEIPADSPVGMCPKCLLQAGLDSRIGVTEPPRADHGFVPPTPAELAARFPQLEILELIGKGGMGAVYKARQTTLDRFVALKILPAEVGADPAFAERFTREARALAKLSHPNIVAVYDFGQSDGLFYFLMEYVDGANLRQTIRGGGMTTKDALLVVPQICDALQFAHDEGIVHRDIKPENILIDRRGRVKIADFGLAKLLGRETTDHTLTATHQVMGTLRYMAPEQMEGSREVDHRADIFSLGVVFYELLTGELPLGRFAPPSQRVQMDVRLDEIVLRSLERSPERRYQHASEIKTQVEAISRSALQTAAPVAPITREAEAPSPVYRYRAPLFGIFAVVVTALFFSPLNSRTIESHGVRFATESKEVYRRLTLSGDVVRNANQPWEVWIKLQQDDGTTPNLHVRLPGLTARWTPRIGPPRTTTLDSPDPLRDWAKTELGLEKTTPELDRELNELYALLNEWRNVAPTWAEFERSARIILTRVTYLDSVRGVSRRSLIVHEWVLGFVLCVAGLLTFSSGWSANVGKALSKPTITKSGTDSHGSLKLLLDDTDTIRRSLQHIAFAAAAMLLLLSGLLIVASLLGRLPTYFALLAAVGIVFAAGLLIVAACTKQVWELEYRGHRIRLENSVFRAERMFIDGVPAAKGGLGVRMELRGELPEGDETIVAWTEAGLFHFRCRLFAETTGTRQVPKPIVREDSPEDVARMMRRLHGLGITILVAGIVQILIALVAGPLAVLSSVPKPDPNNFIDPRGQGIVEVGIIFGIFLVHGVILLAAGGCLVRRFFYPLTVLVVCCSLYPGPLFFLSIPSAIWALSILVRKSIRNVFYTEEPQAWIPSKDPIDPPRPLQARELRWRETPTAVRRSIEGLLALVYLAGFICFFSFSMSASATPESGRSQFTIGVPGPWYEAVTHTSGFHSKINLISSSVLIACIACAVLALSRRLELAERGKVHSLWWHYAAWILVAVMILGLGKMVSRAPKLGPKKPVPQEVKEAPSEPKDGDLKS